MRPKVEASDRVIIGIILIFYKSTAMLFDPGSTFFYVSIYFAFIFVSLCEDLVMPLHVSTSLGDPLLVSQVYQSCVFTFVGSETWVDLILLDMVFFDFML